jgi:hypothetical protein
MNYFQNLLINANFIFFMYKIPTNFLTESSRQRTNSVSQWHHSFVSQQGRLNHIVFCIVFARQDVVIFIFIPVVLIVCLTDSCCRPIRTVIQIERPESCASTTLMSISHTFYKQENEIDSTSTHSMFHLTQQQAPLSLGNMLLWLRGRIPTRRKQSSQADLLRVVHAVMQFVGRLHKNHQHRSSPIQDLI